MTTNPMRGPQSTESGFALIGFLAVLLPLIGLMAAAIMAMQGRSQRLSAEVQSERALQAADAGLDEARLHGVALTLADGVEISRTLPGGAAFTVVPNYLRTDGESNDGDADVDEPDEDVFELVSTGTHGTAVRRIVGYLGRQEILGQFPGAIIVLGATPIVVQDNAASITGVDTDMDGSAGPGPNVFGIGVETPTTVPSVVGALDDRHDNVSGSSPTPSVGQSTGPNTDMAATGAAVQAAANVTLTLASYNHFNFGSGPGNVFNVIYRSGNVSFKNSQGAGVMFVDGNLNIDTNFRFDGIIFVTGRFEMQGNPKIFGAVVVGAASPQIQLRGNSDVVFSSEAIDRARQALPGRYATFQGWQEISSH